MKITERNDAKVLAWKVGQTSQGNMYWSDSTNFSLLDPNVNSGVALAVWDDWLYLAALDDNNQICWTYYNPNDDVWAPYQAIPGAYSEYTPTLAVFGDSLYLAARGHGDDANIWWMKSDGYSWGDYTVARDTAYTEFGPTLVAFGNELYCFARGHRDDSHIWYMKYDGNSWGPYQQIPEPPSGTFIVPPFYATNSAPCAVAYKSWLALGFTHSDPNWDGQYVPALAWFDGSSWEFDGNIPVPLGEQQNVIMDASLAVIGDTLVYVYRDVQNQNLWFYFNNDSNADVWLPPMPVPGASSVNRPALCSSPIQKNTVLLAYRPT